MGGRLAAALWISSFALACNGGTEEARSRLELVVPATGITLAAQASRTIQLLVLGAPDGEKVELSGELPPFATLDRGLLELAPSRADVGRHELTLIATAGAEVARATLVVNVMLPDLPPDETRPNTAPYYGGPPDYWMEDDAAQYIPMTCGGPSPRSPQCCPSDQCFLESSPVLLLFVCDDEGDMVQAEVEVVPLGDSFTGTPTYGATARPALEGSHVSMHGWSMGWGGAACAVLELPLEGLAPATAYEFAVRLRDQWGAAAMFFGREWWDNFGFEFNTKP
jgi:hypothetical protein